MVTQEQRQRALAHAKWERQQQRRAADAARRRRISIIAGVIVGLLAVAGLVWLFVAVGNGEPTPEPLPSTPVSSELPPLLNPLPTDQLPPPRESQPIEGPDSEGQQPTPGAQTS